MDRLEQFEKMLIYIKDSYKDTQDKLEQLKSQGKIKTVSYQQLNAKKLQYQNMLGIYKFFDLTD